MPRIVAVANLKGGVGKSTLAVNTACALTGPHGIAMVVDADSQGTSRFWARQGKLPIQVMAMPLEDRGIPRPWLSRLLTSEDAGDRVRLREWKYRLSQTSAAYVVIDCPPHVGLATRAAVSAAELVLVPVTAAAADISATGAALELIIEERKRRGAAGLQCLIVPSRIDRNTATGRGIERILSQLGEPVGPAICQRVAFADSVAFGQWIGGYAPGSAAHREINALAEHVRGILAESER